MRTYLRIIKMTFFRKIAMMIMVKQISMNKTNGGFDMKKTICLILVLTLCAEIFLGGCSGADTKKEFCRVMCLYEDGMMVWIPDIGYVYVKHVDADLEIAPLDTVVMKFTVSELESANGTFTDFFGVEETYTYILDTPKSIRHTKPGEETYG